MTPEVAYRPRRFRFHVFGGWTTWMAIALAGGIGLTWAGRTIWVAIETRGTPTCSYPAQVRGTPSLAQAGLARCYLQALANGDTSGLKAVAEYIPPVRITKADLRHAADARSGLATVTITQSPVSTSAADVTIVYADGARDQLGMLNMVAMGGPSVWRMMIGTDVDPDSGPPPSR